MKLDLSHFVKNNKNFFDTTGQDIETISRTV